MAAHPKVSGSNFAPKFEMRTREKTLAARLELRRSECEWTALKKKKKMELGNEVFCFLHQQALSRCATIRKTTFNLSCKSMYKWSNMLRTYIQVGMLAVKLADSCVDELFLTRLTVVVSGKKLLVIILSKSFY